MPAELVVKVSELACINVPLTAVSYQFIETPLTGTTESEVLLVLQLIVPLPLLMGAFGD